MIFIFAALPHKLVPGNNTIKLLAKNLARLLILSEKSALSNNTLLFVFCISF